VEGNAPRVKNSTNDIPIAIIVTKRQRLKRISFIFFSAVWTSWLGIIVILSQNFSKIKNPHFWEFF
jgi:hypothetical protein